MWALRRWPLMVSRIAPPPLQPTTPPICNASFLFFACYRAIIMPKRNDIHRREDVVFNLSNGLSRHLCFVICCRKQTFNRRGITQLHLDEPPVSIGILEIGRAHV